MIEPYQVLLISVVVILTILTVLIGWQIYLILSEIRKTIIKFNSIINEASTVASNIGKSLHSMSGFAEGLKTILNLFKFAKSKEGEK